MDYPGVELKTLEWLEENQKRLASDRRLLNNIGSARDAYHGTCDNLKVTHLATESELKQLALTVHNRLAKEAREAGYKADDLTGPAAAPFELKVVVRPGGGAYVSGFSVGEHGEHYVSEQAINDAAVTAMKLVSSPDHDWNRPERLPPVGCDLLILVPAGTSLGAGLPPLAHDTVYSVFRISHLADKDGAMDYCLPDNSVLRGRFAWTYP